MASVPDCFYNDVVKTTPPWGPAPTPPPTEGAVTLEPARRRVLGAVARRGQAGTIDELSAAVGGHVNTTRHHVRALLSAGLVELVPGPSRGRGRPASRYAVTGAGRAALGRTEEGAAEEYVALAAAFAERLAERSGDPREDSRAIGRAWGARLSATAAPGEPAEPPQTRVVRLLDRLGFSPDGPGPTVLLRTCPLLDTARRHPEVVCQVHLGLVDGALTTFGAPGEEVGLEPFGRPGACVLTLPTPR